MGLKDGWFSPNRVRLVERWDIRIGCTKSFQRRLSRASCLKTRPNPGFFMVDISFLIASMYVFFINMALHENNSKKFNTFHVGQTGKNNVFFFPMDADLWVSRGGTKIVARWIWFSSCRSTLASVVKVSLSPSWTRSGRDPWVLGPPFCKGRLDTVGVGRHGGDDLFFSWGGVLTSRLS